MKDTIEGERKEVVKYFFIFIIVVLSFDIISCISGDDSEKVRSIWKAYDGNPVLSVGETDAWDAGALGSMSVLKVGDTFHMYYEAWGVRSDAVWDREWKPF